MTAERVSTAKALLTVAGWLVAVIVAGVAGGCAGPGRSDRPNWNLLEHRVGASDRPDGPKPVAIGEPAASSRSAANNGDTARPILPPRPVPAARPLAAARAKPLPPASKSPNPAGRPVVMVGAGDTLLTIAQRNRVSVADLMFVNILRSLDVAEGHSLILPARRAAGKA